jgi:hypothetical protein
VRDSIVQHGGSQSAEESEFARQEISTSASRTGFSPFCTKTLTSTGPARSGAGEAKTVN